MDTIDFREVETPAQVSWFELVRAIGQVALITLWGARESLRSGVTFVSPQVGGCVVDELEVPDLSCTSFFTLRCFSSLLATFVWDSFLSSLDTVTNQRQHVVA